VLRELGLDEAAAVLRVSESWESAVGTRLAAHCRPVVLRGDVLEVAVDSSVWGQEVQMERLEILARLRELLGANAPRDLRTRVGQ
jgi:predicted nucleic acid-binding Zn ribbon protein